MAQYARPTSDSVTDSWTQGAGDGDGDAFDELDEGFVTGPDDATTYWSSPSNPGAGEYYESNLSSVTDPTSSSSHVYRTRNRKSASGGKQIDLEVYLVQTGVGGITTDAYTNIDEVWTTRGDTLTGAEADAITNYGLLRISTVPSATGGGPGRSCWESAHEFECPDAGGPSPVRHKIWISGAALLFARNPSLSRRDLIWPLKIWKERK